MASLAANSRDCSCAFFNGTKYINCIGFKWHVPFKSFMSFKKVRIYLNDINDLNDINGKPHSKLAGLLMSFKKKWREIFKWHKRV